MAFNPIIDAPRRPYRIRKKGKHNRYTPEMIAFIKDQYSKAESGDHFAKLFNQRFSEAHRTAATLQAKANKLNLSRPKGGVYYSNEEVAFIREHYVSAESMKSFQSAFTNQFKKKRSIAALRNYANDRLGLMRRKQKRNRVNYTEAEAEYMIKYYPSSANLRSFGRAFNAHFKSDRSVNSLSSKAQLLGLERNK